MSVQYRPELGTISLTPRFPLDREREYFYDTAANCQQSSSFQSVKQAYVEKQRQSQSGVMRLKNQSSPISPLSPQESSPVLSEAAPSLQGWSPISHHSEVSSRSEASLESQSLQDEADFYGRSYNCGEQSHKTSSYPSPSSVLRSTKCATPYDMTTYDAGIRHAAEEHYAQARSDYGTSQMSSDVVHMLQILETALLGPDDDDTDLAAPVYQGSDPPPDGSWTMEELLVGTSPLDCQLEIPGSSGAVHTSYSRQYQNASNLVYEEAITERVTEAQPVRTLVETRSRPEQLLVACAEAVANNDVALAHVVIAQLNQVVSIYGDPMQRLAAYMVEGLVARMASTGRGLYKALKCKEPQSKDLLSAMQIMYEVCPYFKFAYMSANGAIAEAFQDEESVHIIDFEIAQGSQWTTLIQALAARPGGPPRLRITGVDDPLSETLPTGGLEVLGERLGKLAESVGVPFVFHAVAKKGTEVEGWMLERHAGEALAVNFALQLHHMPDESVCTTNPRDRLLQLVKSLGPKVVTLVEQEANTNTAPFLPRFMEALSYYSAVFESLDIALARENQDRVKVEQQCLARDIVNVIACEGAERVERHEMTGKWRARMTMAGFRPYPLSASVNGTIKTLLESYSEKYRLEEEGGALFLGWLNRALVVASAWH